MTLPTITTAPAAPNRATDSSATFATKADAFVAWMEGLPAEYNAFAPLLITEAASANYSATSATSVSIGTGAKSLTIDTSKRFVAGDHIMVKDTAAPTTNWMYGTVTSYNSGTGALVIDSLRIGGSGTKTAWLVGLSGPQGIGGDVLPSFSGNAGKLLAVNSGETAAEWIIPDAYLRLAADYTLTSTTAAQKLFNSTTNGALTLGTGHYEFEQAIRVSGMSATSGNAGLDVKGAGTAVLARTFLLSTGKEAPNYAQTDAAWESGQQLGSSFLAMSTAAAAGTGTTLVSHLRGQFEVTTAGTLIPSINLATAAAATVTAASFFRCRRLGSAAYAGSWS